LGRIVELGAVQDVLRRPQHPYTQALLSVVPAPNPRLRRQHIILQGETPDPTRIGQGCRFAPRCPLAQDACRQVDPQLVPVRSLTGEGRAPEGRTSEGHNGQVHAAACILL
jgi:oligopeptide/dipeptide ABC transporter ATP-binding protein